jgi:hypothetical protein
MRFLDGLEITMVMWIVVIRPYVVIVAIFGKFEQLEKNEAQKV